MTNPETEPVCKFEQGCHRVAPCDPGCAAPAAVSVPPPAPRADAAPVAEVWVVWREDQPPYGYFATEDAAKHATIDYWEEDEPKCPDYSWRRDGPRWELVVGGEHGGVYASRHRVYGAPVPPPVDRGAVLREVADWAYRIARRLDDQHRDERAQGAWDVENALRAELRRLAAVSGPCVAGEQQNETPEAETVHGCPPDGSGLTPCCGRTPFELPLTDRISSEAPVTCPGKEA